MKSYKDLDKEIILNAPEGAMWWCDVNGYYKFVDGTMYYYDSWNEWALAGNFQGVADIHAGHSPGIRRSLKPIPLPNIEIPWEATADSVCPVPDGANFCFYNGRHWHVVKSNDKRYALWSTGSAITKYKIIDEDYLKPAQEEPIPVPELEMHRAAYQAIKNAGFESPEELLAEHLALLEQTKVDNSEEQLTNKLKFLQNLADQFPGIKDHALQYMKDSLDWYIEDLTNEGL